MANQNLVKSISMLSLSLSLSLMLGLSANADQSGATVRNAVPGPLALRAPASQPSATSSVIRSKTYEAGSNRTKPLFDMVREEKTDGDQTTIIESYTDLQGNEVFRGETKLQGGKIASYDLQQKQLHESAKILVKDGKIFFEYTNRDGKVKKDEEKWHDNFVLGATLLRYIRAHSDDLMAGRDIDMRFGVPDRCETVGFKIFKEEEKKIDGRDVIIAKMKPTSVIIAALVKPLYFYIDKASGKLLEFRGRVLPKQKDGDRFKDLDAETVYSY
ncbi:MAG: hypothetical protein ACJ763_04925 [Bdellovibrionia bacterium]